MAIKTVTATINGQVTTLTLNSNTGKYEATITAPSKSSYPLSGHYYPVTIKATDTAGNVTTKDASDATLGASLRLVVKEKVAPTLTIVSPTSNAISANNTPKITWKVVDDNSGVNSDSIGLTIDSGTKITSGITKTAITNGYQCEYTPSSALIDGTHTIKFDVSDNDGNASTSSVSFKIDTVPPTLSVTNPVDGLITNKAKLTVTGVTNDATSSPCTVTVNESTATVASNGAFNKDITLVEGKNTITVTSTDKAGKSSTITRTVTLDTKAPTISAITLTPNPVDGGKTFVVAATVSD